jgi:hypothetical protein
VKCGERGKSSGRHSLTSTVKPGLTVSLAKGPLRVWVDLVKGFIRVHWRGFRGDDPGWPRFDRCSAGLTRLTRSLALMTVINNLGRHTSAGRWWLPPWRKGGTPHARLHRRIPAAMERGRSVGRGGRNTGRGGCRREAREGRRRVGERGEEGIFNFLPL